MPKFSPELEEANDSYTQTVRAERERIVQRSKNLTQRSSGVINATLYL